MLRPQFNQEMKDLLENILPKEFFNEIESRTSDSKTCDIDFERCFIWWCRSHCDVDLLLQYVFPCENLHIMMKRDILVGLCKSKRPTDIQKEQLMNIKKEILNTLNDRKKKCNQEVLKQKRKNIAESSENTKRIALFDPSIFHLSEQYPITSDIISHIYSFLYVHDIWVCRSVSRLMYKSSTHCPYHLLIYDDFKNICKNARQLILLQKNYNAQRNDDESVNIRDKALKSYNEIQKYNLKLKDKIFTRNIEYQSMIKFIYQDTLLEWKGKTIMSFSHWETNCGISFQNHSCKFIADTKCEPMEVGKTTFKILYKNFNQILNYFISDNIDLAYKYTYIQKEGENVCYRYMGNDMNKYEFQMKFIHLYRVKNIFVNANTLKDWFTNKNMISTKTTSPTKLYLQHETISYKKIIPNMINSNTSMSIDWIKEMFPSVKKIVLFNKFTDDKDREFRVSWIKKDIRVVVTEELHRNF